ncbi:Polysaccharide biosynthesis protein [Azospirillaceae bacterium]
MRSSLMYSFLEKNATFVLNVISTIILSRLLTPVETGIFSVASGLINISQSIRNFGVANYIIQEIDLPHKTIRSAMGLSLFMGCALFVLFYSTSGLVADFFNEPKLKGVISVLCMNFLVVAVASIGTARLSRDMNYSAVSLINFISSIVFSVVSIVLSYLGYGALSISWASFLGIVTILIGQFLVMKRDFLVCPSFRGWRPLLHFGVFATGNGMLDTLSQRAPDIVIGRLMGFANAGLFSRGNSLITMFETTLIAAVRPVVASGLSALRREGQYLEPTLLQCYNYLTAVAWPFLAVLGLLAYQIILIMFGDQWLQSVPPARLLCIAAFFSSITNVSVMAMTSVGAMRQMFMFQCANSAAVVMAVVAGCFIGLEAVAIGVIAANFLISILSLHYIKAIFGVSILKILRAMEKSALVTVATSLPPGLAILFMDLSGKFMFVTLVIVGLASAAVWGASLLVLKHPLRQEIRHLLSVLSDKNKRKTA